MAGIIDVVDNGESFQKTLRGKTKLIVLIYASWCPFCRAFIPVFQNYAKHNPRLFLMLGDDEEKMAKQFAVNIYPSILYFENGSITKRLDGVPEKGLREEQFALFIDQLGAL